MRTLDSFSRETAHPRLSFVGATFMLAVLGACDASPSPSLESNQGRLINGAPADGPPSIGLLVTFGPDGKALTTCTASVIAPRTALTAAHCLPDAIQTASGPIPVAGVGIYFGSNPLDTPDATFIAAPLASSWERNPQAPNRGSDQYNYLGRYDTALVNFAEPLPDVLEPLPEVPPVFRTAQQGSTLLGGPRKWQNENDTRKSSSGRPWPPSKRVGAGPSMTSPRAWA